MRQSAGMDQLPTNSFVILSWQNLAHELQLVAALLAEQENVAGWSGLAQRASSLQAYHLRLQAQRLQHQAQSML